MMLVPHKYAYLVGTLVFLFIWLFLYSRRKDLRKEMLVMGSFITVAGIIAEYYWWTKDWWRPETITGTIIGIEDIILGFTNGGIAAVLYEEFFRRSLYKREHHTNHVQCLLFLLVVFVVISVSFWIFNHTSFVATTIGLSIGGLILVFLRRDLLISAVMNGVLMSIAAFFSFYVIIFTSPGYIEKTWLFHHLTKIRITGVPLEDVIFYFLVGFVVAPLYEYWQCLGLRKIYTVKKKQTKKRKMRATKV